MAPVSIAPSVIKQSSPSLCRFVAHGQRAGVVESERSRVEVNTVLGKIRRLFFSSHSNPLLRTNNRKYICQYNTCRRQRTSGPKELDPSEVARALGLTDRTLMTLTMGAG